MSNSFVVNIFLLTEASVPRITYALLELGYTVKPHYCDDELFTKDEEGASIPMCVLVSHRDEKKDRQEVSKDLTNALRRLQVPYYASLVRVLGEPATISIGYLPTLKAPKIIPVGPYRTNGQVIPLQPKDDGIIDDDKN